MRLASNKVSLTSEDLRSTAENAGDMHGKHAAGYDQTSPLKPPIRDNINRVYFELCQSSSIFDTQVKAPLPDLSWYKRYLVNTNINRVFPVSSAAKLTDSIGKEHILFVFVSVI